MPFNAHPLIHHRRLAAAMVHFYQAARRTRVAHTAAGNQRRRRERELDDMLAESFPASDPPCWTLGCSTPPTRT